MNLQDLQKINSSNEALKFLAKRIESDNYRGIQVSQHNRYTQNDVVKILSLMYEVAGESLMQIRTADLSRRPQQEPGEELYSQFTKKVKLAIGKGTEDSIRKNYFVDLHRMGFIKRFGPDHKELDLFGKSKCKYVSISKLGISLINAKNMFSQNIIYSQGLDNIFGNLIHDFMNVILLTKNKKLTLQEYTYFVSFLNHSLDGKFYDAHEIVNLLKEYDCLPRSQKSYVDDFLKKYCHPDNFKGNKTNKRDYHNWINESQQIFMLLGQTIYFETNKEELIPRIGKNDDCVFENIANYKRSAWAKDQYFQMHKLTKTLGYELHHIVPLNFAKNRNEFVLIDDWHNLVYIDGKTHSQLSQTGNINNILAAENDDLLLKSYSGDTIRLRPDQEVLYNRLLQPVMIEYNAKLRGI